MTLWFSQIGAVKALGPFDVVLFHDAQSYVHDWEACFADVARNCLVEKTGKVCVREDKDVGFVLGDDCVRRRRARVLSDGSTLDHAHRGLYAR